METTTRYAHEIEYEEERGKPVPSISHSRTELRLGVAFFRYEPEYTSFIELSLELDGWRGTPDICVYPHMEIDPLNDKVRMTEPPLIAVEIISPSQSQQDLVDKIRAMLDAGVQSCWLVQPALRTITVFAGAERPETFTRGTLADPATGIEVDLAEVFPE